MKSVENKIRKAFENATPNIVNTVLSECCEEKGTVIPMTEKKRNRFKLKEFAATAAAVVLLFGVGYFAAGLIGSQSQPSQGPTSGGRDYTYPLDLNAKPLDKNSAEYIALKDIFKDDLEKLEYPPIVSSNLNEAQDAPYYDVEITFSNLTYNYKIDAYTGNIKNNGTVKNLSENMITRMAALDIAIEDSGIVSLKLITKLNISSGKDYGGVNGYIIRFGSAHCSNEYEYTIDAYTGNIIMHTVEPRDDSDYPELALKNVRERSLCVAFALEDAGILRNEIYYLDTEFENNCYDIVFFTDGCDHNYKIDAVTGDILYTTDTDQVPDGKISANMAIDLAVEYFTLKRSDVMYESFELDDDHYDVTFVSGIYVYKCEVGIYSCEISGAEKEPIKYGNENGTTELKELISSGKAVELAVKHFNLNISKLLLSSQSMPIECEIDDDDGRNPHYDVSFEFEGCDYECEVDLFDGTVRNAEKELED